VETRAHKIVDRILDEAREDAESMVLEARKAAEMMIEEQKQLARQKASEKVSSMLNDAKNEVRLIQGVTLTETKRKAGWAVLSEKDRLITNAMNEAKLKLIEFAKTQKYLPLLEKLIVQAGTVLGGGDIHVALNDHDSKLPVKLDKLAKEIEAKTETKTRLELSKDRLNASGGVALKTTDGKIVVHNTFETILRRRETDLKPKIANALFK
jgi:V/A-type H+-transporting ATPase subunit E